MSDFNVNIDEPFLNFQNHIKIDGNNRILFSGKFGSGKTFFLKKYFERHVDKYNTFWLVPVDYSVSNNEDIFEYIKVDISKQLLPLLPKEPQEKFSEILYLQQFIIHSPLKVLGSILSNVKLKIKPTPITEIEVSIKDIIEKLPKEYSEFKKAIQKKSDDKLTKNIEIQLERKGSIYEDDIITQTIRTSIEFLKNQDKKKESVLVIDDLDRLDPEHIFRILNVLSAHNNHWGEDNKFGFDKIIIVCDVENIQKIFEHKYGKDVDFNGYIDKFYAYSIYHFSNEEGIKLFCKSKFRNDLGDVELFLLAEILIKFHQYEYVTLRKLRKSVFNINFQPNNITQKYIRPQMPSKYLLRPLVDSDFVIFKTEDFKFLKVVQILNHTLGDFKNLITISEKLSQTSEGIFINDKERIKFYNSFGLLHHCALNQNTPELFYSTHPIEGRNALIYSYPTYNNYIITLPWFSEEIVDEKKYDSDESYFKDATFKLPQNLRTDHNLDSETSIKIFKILYQIIVFISKNKDFANAIGVTS